MARHSQRCGCYDCHIARARRERLWFWTVVIVGMIGVGLLLWFNFQPLHPAL